MTTTSPASAPTGIAKKLRVRPGARIWVSDASLVEDLGGLPEGAATVNAPATASVALLVARDRDSLRDQLTRHRADLLAMEVLWVVYPKAGPRDLTRDTTWPVLVEFDLRPIGQASIGDRWSAMRFRPLAPGEAAFSGRR
jgi:hypothetical protein